MAKDTLQQREARYRKVRQPGVLERLPNGLMIVRRYKHEWDERLNGLTHRELAKEAEPIRFVAREEGRGAKMGFQDTCGDRYVRRSRRCWLFKGTFGA